MHEHGVRPEIEVFEVESLLDSVRRHGIRYVFSTDHSISINVDCPDCQYMLEVFRDNMAY